MSDIDNVMDMLDCNNSEEIQEKGIKLAKQIKDLSVFLQPTGLIHDKNVWENCARIVCKRSDVELAPYLTSLLAWLQDLNWPGVFIVIDRLRSFSGDLLLKPFIQTIDQISDRPANDNEWLDNISILIENEELRERLDPQLCSSLCSRHNDFWGDKKVHFFKEF